MPVITQISPTKRNARRMSVFLDGAFAFALSINVVARFRLRVGATLSAESITSIQQGEVRQDCQDQAFRMLQSRLHSRSQLHQKLLRKEFTAEMIGQVLDELVRMDYVNDARFAKTKAMSAAQHKHHGRRRAMMELQRAGVKGETAKTALDEVYEKSDSLAVAKALAEKQSARLKKLDPAVARRRLAGMLQRRGFEYEIVKPVIDHVLGKVRD